MSCGVGCRCGSNPALLWLWCRLAAVAPIRPLARGPPYAASRALKSKKKKKQKKTPKNPEFLKMMKPLFQNKLKPLLKELYRLGYG